MRFKRWIIIAVVVVLLGAGGIWGRRYYYRHQLWVPPDELGEYAGPLTRPIAPFKPTTLPWLDPQRTAPPLTRYETFHASSLGGQKTFYLLYLPPGYDDPARIAQRYPVIYWLHGSGCQPQHGAPFVEGLDAAIRAGKAPPMIAVLPNGLVDGWYVDSADGTRPVESIFMRDLIPHIDRTYRTIADRRGRAVEGFSMGAWGAARLAFKHPEQFCAAGLVSPPITGHLFPIIQALFDGSRDAFYTEEPTTLARRNAGRLKSLVRVRILAGEKDWTITPAKNFAHRLRLWQIPNELTIVPRANHDTMDIYQALGHKAFEFYNGVFIAGK